MKNLSIIFDNKPNKWGYRGDPYMWEYLKEYCKNIPLDCGEDRIKEIVKEQFKELTGEELTKKSDCYIEKFAHGGMSSGRVDGSFWLETGIPLLIKNYKRENRKMWFTGMKGGLMKLINNNSLNIIVNRFSETTKYSFMCGNDY